MKHVGNLEITTENASQYENLTEVIGWLYIREGATLTAPALTEVTGGLYIREGATLTAPALTEVIGGLYIREGATITKIGGIIEAFREDWLTGQEPVASEHPTT